MTTRAERAEQRRKQREAQAQAEQERLAGQDVEWQERVARETSVARLVEREASEPPAGLSRPEFEGAVRRACEVGLLEAEGRMVLRVLHEVKQLPPARNARELRAYVEAIEGVDRLRRQLAPTDEPPAPQDVTPDVVAGAVGAASPPAEEAELT